MIKPSTKEELKAIAQTEKLHRETNELYSYIKEGIAKARQLEVPIARAYALSLVSGRKSIKQELKIAALSLARVDVRLSLAEIELKQEEKKG